jgi:plastocyanin
VFSPQHSGESKSFFLENQTMKRIVSIFASCLMLCLLMLIGTAHSAHFVNRPAAATVVELIHSKTAKEGWAPPHLKIYVGDKVRFVNKRQNSVWIECKTAPNHDEFRFRLTSLDPIERGFGSLGTYKLVCKHGGPTLIDDPKDDPGEIITIEVVARQ